MMDLKLLENILAYYYDQARIYGGGERRERALPPPPLPTKKKTKNKTKKTKHIETNKKLAICLLVEVGSCLTSTQISTGLAQCKS